MKTLALLITSILALQLQPVLAASPDEEARFIAAAKQAFAKHDADALAALSCWDGVPDKLKKDGKEQYAPAASAEAPPVVEAKLVNPAKSDLQWGVDDDPRFMTIDPAWKETGVGYHSNLPIVKELKLTFAPMKANDNTSVTIDVTYPVGEKDGKLYFIEPTPVKK
jgi:hypothetical protein